MPAPAVSPNLAGDPSEIGGYAVERTLIPNQSWLAAAPGGRRVVLKVLDADCLWKGQLHPNIKDRLGRVRELAHAGVANLYGVERDAGLTFLVWEYVPGETFAERTASPRCAPRDFLNLARELVLGVEMLHARGIVHGVLTESNVFCDADGRVVITHVSPLLYTEPSDDVQAVVTLLTTALAKRGETTSPLAQWLAGDEAISLRRLAARLGALIESRDTETPEPTPSDRVQGRTIRRRALAGAGAVALIGVAVFFGVRQYAAASTPRPPVPPQAPPAAMKPAPGESPTASLSGLSTRRATP
jgi:serine/threonine protein kinase